MGLLKQLAVIFAIIGCIDGFRMVITRRHYCHKKRASAKIYTSREYCATIQGSSSTDTTWHDCDVDMCDLPSSGYVSHRKAWGVDMDQGRQPSSSTRVHVKFFLMRKECDALRGTYDGNPTADEWTGCYLYVKSMDGSDRKNIDSLIFAGDKQCPNKVANARIQMTNRECVQNGGRYSGNPGGRDWTDCELDMCISPVIKCTPSDMWTPIMVCHSTGTTVTTCTFEMTVGVVKSSSSSSTLGGSVSTTISYEAGVELEGLFTSKLAVSVTTGFNWSSTKSTSQLWSKATKRTFTTQVDPGKSVSINQVVGMCGDYKVDTFEYSLTDATKKK